MSALPASAATELRFRYAREWEGEPIPTGSPDGTVYTDLSDSEPTIEITAPWRVHKGMIGMTFPQAVELANMILALNAFREESRTHTEEAA